MRSTTSDPLMRRQVERALRAQPAATLDTVLASWGTQHGQPVSAPDAERLGQIWADVQLTRLIQAVEQAERPWWRRW